MSEQHREVIIAPDGMLLTDGETYGSRIFIALGRSKDEFHAISREAYDEIAKEKELETWQ